MRVLHLDTGREMRGGQWQVLRLVEGLSAQGTECTLLARAGTPLFEAAHAASSGACRVEPLTPARVFALARRHHLVHAHDARSHTLAALAGGAPLVVSRRVAFPIRSAWKYNRARHYIAVSEFVKRVLIEGGVPADRISVVYDSVPLLQPAAGDVVLAPANQADPRKGAALAVEAARLAGVDLKFSCALETDLAHAALFVYITHSEGLGSAALLAMAAGVPVVASNVGGLPEIVADHRTGLLVPNEPAAIAAAIRELRADPELALSLGAAGRRRVAEEFSIDRMVRRTMEFYTQVLK